MPRKVSQPPPILAIQSLSTGKRLDLVSDFPDKQEIPHEYAGPLPSGDELLRAKRQAEVDQAALLLQALGIIEGKPKPQAKLVAPEIEGMRPIGMLGDRMMYRPKPAWRRF